MKTVLVIGLVALLSSPALAKEEPAQKRKPAATECATANKELAQTMINNAAKRFMHKAETLTLSWVNATGDRYVYTGSIYKAEYEVIVKTDSSCSPLEVELVDLARK